ncbi:MAG: class I SAM-dependent methyltransferase [Fibrobacterota bacterium]
MSTGDFYDRSAEFYDEIFSGHKKQKEFIESFLKEGDVLEAGCGTGELAFSLQGSGYSVTATDISSGMTAAAESKNHIGGPIFKTVSMTDLNDFFSDKSYDIILCLGNTLPHLKNKEEVKRFFSDSEALLRSGGLLLLQTVNFDRILKERPACLPEAGNSGLKMERRYDYSAFPDKIIFQPRILSAQGGEEKVAGEEPLLPLRSGEIRDFLEERGFCDISFYGDYDLSEFGPLSPAMVVSARKKGL